MTLAAAVEGLARAMGWWMDARGVQVDPTSDWTIGVWAKCGFIVRRRRLLTDGGSVTDETWDLTSHEAMLVLRCALLGATRVRCPDCEGGWVHHKDEQVWPTPQRVSSDIARPDVPARCVKCVETKGTIPGKPTAHVDRAWAEVFLAAGPRPAKPSLLVSNAREPDFLDSVADAIAERRNPREQPGDPEARTLLTRLADDLMSPALDPLDEARRSMADSKARCDLGLWLALHLGQQPCEVCDAAKVPWVPGRQIIPIILDTETRAPWCCAGSGLALGAHDQAMAEAGERLAEQLGAAAVGPA